MTSSIKTLNQNMSTLKRAKTWDISESEGASDSEESKPTITCTPAGKNDDVLAVPSSEGIKQDDGSQAEGIKEVPDCPETQSGDVKAGLVPPLTATQRSPGGKSRRTREEIEADRAKAEEKRATRETLKRERKQEKEEKRQEQQKRREAAERLKSYRPDKCLKCLTVRVHPVLLQDAGSDLLLGTLSGLEWRSSIEGQDLSHSITWTRHLPQTEDDDGPVEEEQVLMVVSLNEFMDMVLSVQQTLHSNSGDSEAECLFTALSDFLDRNTGKVLTVLVTGAQHNNWSGSWEGDEALRSQLGMEDVDIEEVLVFLQLCKNVCVHFIYGWQEVTDHVCAVTKALSKRPYKALTESAELPFCVDGSWAGGVRVERDGTGLGQVWTRQIQQFNRVSPALAAAVTAAYPSPQRILQAYQKVESEGERRSLLADLPVMGGAKERRVGPELSARVHRFLTTQNPQLVLD